MLVLGLSTDPLETFSGTPCIFLKNRPSFYMSVAVVPSCFSFVALPCVSSRVETLNISTKDVFGLLLRPSLENWQTHSEIFHNAFPPCSDKFDQVIKFENQYWTQKRACFFGTTTFASFRQQKSLKPYEEVPFCSVVSYLAWTLDTKRTMGYNL